TNYADDADGTAQIVRIAANGAANVISGNSAYGIDIGSDGNVVEGNLVGTDATGLHAVGNGFSPGGLGAIALNVYGANNVIGGTTPLARDVVSGNSAATGISISGVSNAIEGNYVGVDVTGNTALGNVYGVSSGGSGNT